MGHVLLRLMLWFSRRAGAKGSMLERTRLTNFAHGGPLQRRTGSTTSLLIRRGPSSFLPYAQLFFTSTVHGCLAGHARRGIPRPLFRLLPDGQRSGRSLVCACH